MQDEVWVMRGLQGGSLGFATTSGMAGAGRAARDGASAGRAARGRGDGAGAGRAARGRGGGRRRGRPCPANGRHTARSRSIHSGVQRTATRRGQGRPRPTNARHTARSRSIHSGVQRTLASLGGALAGRDGFCDCAQNDEVCAQRALREWRAGGTAGRGTRTPLPCQRPSYCAKSQYP